MKIVQINTTVNSGSTGRIAEDIGRVSIDAGHESYIAFGRGNRLSKSNLIRIGNKIDFYGHVFQSLIFDRHGFASKSATESLVKELDRIKPDVVGLHNLHGYYIHLEVLFAYLKKNKIPVIWTLFDCWSFTGHCSYFDDINCEKWISQCYDCPKIKMYPKSIMVDNSERNYLDKSKLFTHVENLEIIVHSNWLSGLVHKSFLKEYPVHVIRSGIDLEVFRPIDVSDFNSELDLDDKKMILGCASIWDERKGLADFIALDAILNSSFQIVLIGLSVQQLKELPPSIIGLSRTENLSELTNWYNVASVFVNPTYQDNFPTTNLEALACGTPVVTYDTGGSPEAVDSLTGRVVDKGDIEGLLEAIKEVTAMNEKELSIRCRKRAVELFNKDDRYLDYLEVYIKLLDNAKRD
jgi:glycosyltransferase involved in cell wall biosynthesis